MNSIQFKDITYVPLKIVCIGRNYVEHIEELNNEVPENMVIFNKPNSSISKSFKYFEDTRFEGEISFLIESGNIAGVGFGFDLTKYSVQNYLKSKGLPWERAKSFNGSAIFSRFEHIDSSKLEDLSFKLYRNGELAQSAGCESMIYKPSQIVEEIKSFMSLDDGDIVMSGTPKGVSSYQRGDEFKAMVFLEGDTIIEDSWYVE
jgi:2-keto-4-pentenoate hydratase/2-oxohepta-3-ene-1,7-dioic acid hydratase in catechol pathway